MCRGTAYVRVAPAGQEAANDCAVQRCEEIGKRPSYLVRSAVGDSAIGDRRNAVDANINRAGFATIGVSGSERCAVGDGAIDERCAGSIAGSITECCTNVDRASLCRASSMHV